MHQMFLPVIYSETFRTLPSWVAGREVKKLTEARQVGYIEVSSNSSKYPLLARGYASYRQVQGGWKDQIYLEIRNSLI